MWSPLNFNTHTPDILLIWTYLQLGARFIIAKTLNIMVTKILLDKIINIVNIKSLQIYRSKIKAYFETYNISRLQGHTCSYCVSYFPLTQLYLKNCCGVFSPYLN